MKSLLGVLCLGLVLVYSRADDNNDCDKTLGPDELHQLDGDWVLMWALIDKTKGALEEVPDMTSSHLETRVQPDRHTLVAHERNVFSGGKCAHYNFNLVLPQMASPDGRHRLNLANAMETKDGETKPFNDKGVAQFFPSDKHTVLMHYVSEKYGAFIGVYSREGQHLDNMEKHHEELKALAKCQNMEGENFVEWSYDGADFCHKKSVLPTLDSDELHQVEGNWVLVWMAYDKIKSHNYPLLNFNSSYLELHVQPDNHTVFLHEHNLGGETCVAYKGNLTLPQDSERIHRLHMEDALEIVNGVENPYHDNATAEFFPSSDNTLEMYYKSEKHGPFLLFYRREGQHVDDLEKDHANYKAKAKYLGLDGENFEEWHYEGLADFCHKKSVLPTLDSDELYKVHGDWVLIWSTYDKTKTEEEYWANITSSHMQFHVHPDKHTVHMLEHNRVGDKCYTYNGNLVLPQNSEKIHHLHLEEAKLIIDGMETPYNDVATAEFFPSAENSMELLYKSENHGHFLLFYRREGQHVDDLEKDHENYKAKAKYLGLDGENFGEWSYELADFCHKKSVLPTLDSDELHKVHGDWVLIWSTYDKTKNHVEQWVNKSSSHIEMHVHPDKHTVHMLERNLLIGEKCVSFKGNLVLPQNSEKIHRLHLEDANVIVDGVETPENDRATAEFFLTSDNSVELFYKSENHGPFLIYLRREGQHVDVLEEDHAKYKAKAKYLGLSGENFVEWQYEGLADFCHKKSVLPTLDSDELHKVQGDWLLVWMVYDKIKSQGDPCLNFSISNTEFQVQPDNHTIHMTERNRVGQNCVIYKANLVLPQNSEKLHRLHMEDAKSIINRVETADIDKATAEFFTSPENTLALLLRSENHGYYLQMFRKAGQLLELTELEKDYEHYRELAKYLGLSGDIFKEWHFGEASASEQPCPMPPF